VVELKNTDCSNEQVSDSIHLAVWLLLIKQSDAFIKDETLCPYTRFLIASHLKEPFAFASAQEITPDIASVQWCFRATSGSHIARQVIETEQADARYDSIFQYPLPL
jgi:hypothetical protein